MAYLFILFVIFALIIFFPLMSAVSLWFRAFVSGAPVGLFNIIGMRLRKIPPKFIVDARIVAYKAGLKDLNVELLETHFLAGGHVIDVVRSMVAADKANIPLTWSQATAIDLAGRNIFEAVRTSVYPKVIDCPPQGEFGEWISAVSKDGIELKCKARVTVRTNIAQLVGGATEETIVARVGEGIVSSIGDAKTHQEVLASPELITKKVLQGGLDTGTAFEILSIDIADISVGDNIGARLREAQAKSDMEIARSDAEKRRAMAVALEQENSAKVKEAEARLPLAIAAAFESGQLGIMDYMRLKNIEADTQMRHALAADESDA